MKEHIWSSFILELVIAALCLFFGFNENSLNEFVIYALAILCLITARLFVALLKAPIWLSWICALLCIGTVFMYGQAVFLPLAGLIVFNVVCVRFDNRSALVITLVLSALLAIVFPQESVSLLALIVGLVLAYFDDTLVQRVQIIQKELVAKDESIASLELQLENQRSTINAIEQQSRQAERNRLTARIHDQVGHGMTGSILMLEAARLQIDNNPEAALASISKATENLRDSVDNIRRELREERSTSEQVSLVKIARVLDEFSESHKGITTELVTEGALLDSIPQFIWSCIYESLLESLTNMLKHSNGDRFRLFISLQNRLVYVEFSDNGSDSKSEETKVNQGIGLASIEERVLLNGGKVFFSKGPLGFRTRMTFALRGHL